jgi:hypothetical protein
MPEPVQGSPRTPWWRRRSTIIAAVALLLVLLLGIGLTIWLTRPDPPADRGPFEQAIASVAAQKGVRFRSETSPAPESPAAGPSSTGDDEGGSKTGGGTTPTKPTGGGGSGVEVTSSSTGEVRATVTAGGMTVEMAKVGERDYTKVDLGSLAESLPSSAAGSLPGASALDGKWFTDGEESTLADAFPPPQEWARSLRAGVDAVETLPAEQELRTSVDGTPALWLDTPAGKIYITDTAPYRLLKVVPPKNALPKVPDLPGLPSAGGTSAASPLDPSQLSVAPITNEEMRAFYDRMITTTQQLKNASNTGLRLSLQGSGVLKCGTSGCTATEKVTGKLSAGNQVKITGGQVSATMNVTFVVGGATGGSCTTTGALKVSGDSVSGSLSCRSAPAGAVFSRQQSAAKSRAQAQSRAAGGIPIPYSVQSTASASVAANALAQGEITAEVDKLKQARAAVPQ